VVVVETWLQNVLDKMGFLLQNNYLLGALFILFLGTIARLRIGATNFVMCVGLHA